MGSWGAVPDNDKKPNFLPPEQASQVIATARGWEIPQPGTALADGVTELLVAVRGLLTISDASPNDTPSLYVYGDTPGTPPTKVKVDTEYSFTVYSGHIKSLERTLTIEDGPTWFDTVTDNNDGTWTFSGTPTDGDEELDAAATIQSSVTISASPVTTDLEFTISVYPDTDSPSFFGTPIEVGEEDAEYEFTFAVSQYDGNTVTVEATTIPDWLDLVDNEDGTWTLTGTPLTADIDTHAIVLTASDGINDDTTLEFDIVVSGA